MDKVGLILAFAMVIGTLAVCSADSTDVEDLYTSPESPYEDSDFVVRVHVHDDDGIEKIKLYADGDYEDEEDCDNDTSCSVGFSSHQSQPGLYEYEIKVYDSLGNTKTDSIDVVILQRSSYCGDGICVYPETTYTCQSDCGYAQTCVAEGGTFSIYQYAPRCCSGLTSLSPASPDSYGNCPTTPVVGSSVCTRCGNGICGAGENKCNCPSDCYVSAAYCGNGICSGGETCSTCPTDCGACQVINYCGNGICSGGESCSTCPNDCGACQQRILPAVVYTCDQLGGDCCKYGGTGGISGAADCGSSCYSTCNEEPAEPSEDGSGSGGTQGQETPSGAVVLALDTNAILVGIATLMLVLLVILVVKIR